jgi:hypothetical protein
MFRLHIAPAEAGFQIVRKTAEDPVGTAIAHFALEEHARGWLSAHLRTLNAVNITNWLRRARITTPIPGLSC